MSLLLKAGINFKEYNALLAKYGLQHYKKQLIEIAQGFRDGEYLGLNHGQLKKSKQALLKKIKESN